MRPAFSCDDLERKLARRKVVDVGHDHEFVRQAMQAASLTLILLMGDPAALRAVLRSWRQSLGAGLCGATASAGWFVALALTPAAPVRALGVIEAPIAALAGHRLFRETLAAKQMLAGMAVIGGVILTSLR